MVDARQAADRADVIALCDGLRELILDRFEYYDGLLTERIHEFCRDHLDASRRMDEVQERLEGFRDPEAVHPPSAAALMGGEAAYFHSLQAQLGMILETLLHEGQSQRRQLDGLRADLNAASLAMRTIAQECAVASAVEERNKQIINEFNAESMQHRAATAGLHDLLRQANERIHDVERHMNELEATCGEMTGLYEDAGGGPSTEALQEPQAAYEAQVAEQVRCLAFRVDNMEHLIDKFTDIRVVGHRLRVLADGNDARFVAAEERVGALQCLASLVSAPDEKTTHTEQSRLQQLCSRSGTFHSDSRLRDSCHLGCFSQCWQTAAKRDCYHARWAAHSRLLSKDRRRTIRTRCRHRIRSRSRRRSLSAMCPSA